MLLTESSSGLKESGRIDCSDGVLWLNKLAEGSWSVGDEVAGSGFQDGG